MIPYFMAVCLTLGMECEIKDEYREPEKKINQVSSQCDPTGSGIAYEYCKMGLTYIGPPRIDISARNYKLRMKYRTRTGIQITFIYQQNLVVERKEDCFSVKKIFEFD